MAISAIDLYPPPSAVRMPVPGAAHVRRDRLIRRFQRARAGTTGLVASLSAEDQMAQSAPGTSPAKWHLAHTTWFFESSVLERHVPGYTPYDDVYAFLFDQKGRRGARHPATRRGMLSRPTQAEVARYRDHVNAAMLRLLNTVEGNRLAEVEALVTLGIHHEHEHQEQLLADIKHLFWSLPQQPAYRVADPPAMVNAIPQKWFAHAGGVVEIGAFEQDASALGHERPRHRTRIDPFRLAGRLVTCGEYLEFMEDGGYAKPSLWSEDGLAAIEAGGWRAPLYWQRLHGEWLVYTLGGVRPLLDAEPVCHVSFHEAEAFARWAGRRLPRENEWEPFAQDRAQDRMAKGNLLQSDHLHPQPTPCAGSGPWQVFGDCWEWTASPAVAYPGFRPSHETAAAQDGRLGCNRMVARGSSCVTPAEHVSATRRHLLRPETRLAFTGIRLAEDG